MNIEELVRAVREMRRLQKGFFASEYGSQERQAFLRESRKAERRVDDLLSITDGQAALFGEEEVSR